DPSNNYYYSDLMATMVFGVAARGDHERAAGWLGCFRSTQMNRLIAKFGNELTGGGSRQGTGYGGSHRELFRRHYLFLSTTGDHPHNTTPHALASRPWILHAITPDQKFIAPIGDHTRDETAKFYDYHRLYIESLVDLYATNPLARFGQWVARNTTVVDLGRLK